MLRIKKKEYICAPFEKIILMRQYEVTFIVDPVLPGDEIKKAAQSYEDLLKKEGCKIVAIDELGLKTLAYPINKRNSGLYFTHEFQAENGAIIPKLELAMKRDERIMRYLTIKLDKYGVKYNDDKRNGKIGKKQEHVSKLKKDDESLKIKDDLTRIEGIGPKIAQLLKTAGITSYAKLSDADSEQLKDILAKGGSAYLQHDPGAWPAQANLAAAKDWESLDKMQDELKGGKAEEE